MGGRHGANSDHAGKGGLAVRWVSAHAGGALAAGGRHADGHPIPFLDLNAGARRRHMAHPFVPADGRVVRLARLIGMNVSAADAAIGNVHHRLARLRAGIGHLHEIHRFLARH